jgi:hypothetical protein
LQITTLHGGVNYKDSFINIFKVLPKPKEHKMANKKRLSVKQVRFFAIALICIVMAVGLVLVGCDNGSGDDDGIGCSRLSSGTKCTEHSICSNQFLCLTGQGSDSDCTTSCSCQ